MSGERDALGALAARLEEVAGLLARAPDEELEGLAERALSLSAEITARLPRALREAEDPRQE